MNKKVNFQLVAMVTIFVFAIFGVTWVSGQEDQPQVEPSTISEQTRSTTQLLASLGSAFTYQGELEDDGKPANGTYDFSFRLLDGPDPGTASQVGSPVEVSDVIVSDGVFMIELDFGASPFAGEARWLEISVAKDGDSFTVLSPTQPLTAVPYALYGEDADANPTNEFNTDINFTGTTLQITDGGGTQSQNIGTFNGNLIITTNGRLGVREPSPITDLHITQSDGLIGGTGGATFSRGTNWKIMHTGSHFSFVENNVRRAYVETGTGNYVIVSDETKKKDIEPLGSVLDGVLQLKPVQYHYLTQTEDATKINGFIAQDVSEVFPELTRIAEDGTMGLSYADFGVLAIAAIQEQQTQIEALKRENVALRAEIGEIHNMLTQGNGSTAGTEPSTFQYASFTAANSFSDDTQTGSFFSGSNLIFLVITVIVMALLWNWKQKDGVR